MEGPHPENRAPEALADDQTIREPRASVMEQRRHLRKRVIWGDKIDTKDGLFNCLVLNVSRGGAKLYYDAPIPDQIMANLVFQSFGMLTAEVVWQRGNNIGIRFTVAPEQVANFIGHALAL